MRGAGRGPSTGAQVGEETIGNVGGLSKRIVERSLTLIFTFSSLLYVDIVTISVRNLFTIHFLVRCYLLFPLGRLVSVSCTACVGLLTHTHTLTRDINL